MFIYELKFFLSFFPSFSWLDFKPRVEQIYLQNRPISKVKFSTSLKLDRHSRATITFFDTDLINHNRNNSFLLRIFGRGSSKFRSNNTVKCTDNVARYRGEKHSPFIPDDTYSRDSPFSLLSLFSALDIERFAIFVDNRFFPSFSIYLRFAAGYNENNPPISSSSSSSSIFSRFRGD